MSERRSTRGRWVGLVLLLAGAAGLSSLPVWVRATGVSALAGEVPVPVSGSAAAPLVPATALVLAAAGAAIALAGPVGRWVVAAIVAIGGLAVAAAAAAVLVDPSGPAIAAAAAQTGVDHLTGTPAATAWPWAAVLVGLLTVLAAAGLARAARSWSATSRRHEARRSVTMADEPDARADWDALSGGADPSEGGPGADR